MIDAGCHDEVSRGHRVRAVLEHELGGPLLHEDEIDASEWCIVVDVTGPSCTSAGWCSTAIHRRSPGSSRTSTVSPRPGGRGATGLSLVGEHTGDAHAVTTDRRRRDIGLFDQARASTTSTPVMSFLIFAA